MRPSVPINTSLELSVLIHYTSAPFSFIRGLSQTTWTHRDIFGAICKLSATIGTHQLHSMTVRNHLYPSTHVLVLVNKLQDPSTPVRSYVVPLRDLRSYLATFSNHQNTSATLRDCQKPSVPIDTCSGPSQQTSGPLSFIRGQSKTIWTHQGIFRAIWLLSAIIGTHHLHSVPVRDHL